MSLFLEDPNDDRSAANERATAIFVNIKCLLRAVEWERARNAGKYAFDRTFFRAGG
jgi:hypothetical protein